MLCMQSVRAYMNGVGPVSPQEIAVHFDTSPEVAQQVLDRWLAKGKVQVRPAGSCSGCGNCQCGRLYEWMGD
ncbi:FeoC-like transcriptional regulator [Pararhodospirillum photometricum]|uniref:FeoC-like transcriptional regulator n=1 Tax=Pararhodospirillum photometricum TaxID=1084 RepID=UPI0002E2F985|nr:FeoC-like transcriptional regulator [Pararhodospirillum photometricum]